MTTPCGRLDLERYVCGELDSEQSAAVRQHCDTCKECSSYVAMLQDEREEFLTNHPFASFSRAHAPVVRLPWYRGFSLGTLRPAIVAVGAVILVTITVVPVVNRGNRTSRDLVRFKGAPPLSFVYQRDGQTFPGTLSGKYREGDRIQITCSPSDYPFVSLLSIDSRGTVSFYQPDTRSAYCTVPAESGKPLLFPGSIELDATPGAELVIALFSREELSTAKVTGWITKRFAAESDPGALNSVLLREKLPFGAEIATLLLRKE